jgi:hypothetical protein
MMETTAIAVCLDDGAETLAERPTRILLVSGGPVSIENDFPIASEDRTREHPAR